MRAPSNLPTVVKNVEASEVVGKIHVFNPDYPQELIQWQLMSNGSFQGVATTEVEPTGKAGKGWMGINIGDAIAAA